MNRFVASTIITLLIACAAHKAIGAITIHVDVEPGVEGIQTSRVVATGESFDVEVIIETDAAGIASYGFSVQYDNIELQLTAVVDSPVTPLISLNASVDEHDLGNGFSQLSSFDGVTLSVGPSDTSFVAGTLTFTSLAQLEDGTPDIIPGFFAIADGAFDNTLPLGQDLKPSATLNSSAVAIAAEASLPELSIQKVAETIMLSWPGPNDDVILQQSVNLQTDSWLPANGDTQLLAGRQIVEMEIIQSQVFFRLAFK